MHNANMLCSHLFPRCKRCFRHSSSCAGAASGELGLITQTSCRGKARSAEAGRREGGGATEGENMKSSQRRANK